MPRLAVLFGAGASFGAGGVTPYSPPLGFQLLLELEKSCPETWGCLPPERKQALRDDFETGMADLWEAPELAPSQLFIEMGLYFTRFDPPGDGRDCYSRVVIALKARKLLPQVVIATLNYDCVLDVAASQAGVRLAYVGNSGLPPSGNLLILKPHGACNLLPTANVSNLSMVAAGAQSGFYDGEVTVPPSLPAVRERYAQGLAIPPAMSMYTRDKHSPVAPTFLSHSRMQWRNWVSSCSHVLCVGARPVLWDKHVWRPIIERETTTWFVGGRDDGFKALAAELGDDLKYLGATFDGALQTVLSNLDDFHRPVLRTE